MVHIATTDRGIRLVEAQELQENVFCASSVVECKDSSFLWLVLNLNSTDETLKAYPRTQGLPKLTGNFQDATNRSSHARNQILQTQLRLAHEKRVRKKLGRFVQSIWMFLNYREIN